MEILSRLVGGASVSPTRQAGFNQPQQRLIRFKKVHDQLLQIWRRNKSSKQDVPAETTIACLESIHKILQDELHTSDPHLCARYASTFQIYTTLGQIAASYCNEPIIYETLEIFKVLTDSEEVEFLEEIGFADALICCISKISTTGSLMVSDDTEARLVEVLFVIAAKLRLEPKLLPTWFRPNTQRAVQNGVITNARAEKDVFPLFYLTLDYVHHEGRAGDFARTGLLYIIESATHSEALEKWIVESDLATLMASGLGALYSQLSRKLVLSFAKDSVPAIVSFSEAPRPRTPTDAKRTTSPDFQAHLATFLSYLVFWQDVLEHCSSKDIKQSLLDHFKFLFLQQLLYPSLVESSDVDGGSSVAVLTYLRCIIESIDHADLLRITLQYLLALPDKVEESVKPARPTTLARQRKSQTLITNLAQGQEKPMPDLFTLVDLILTILQSRNQQTVTATLRLVSVLISGQHQYALSSIVKTQPSGDGLPARTMGAHMRDTAILFAMIEDLIVNDDLGEAYDAHLQDAQTLLESHCCSSSLLALPNADVAGPVDKEKLKAVQSHTMRLEDPLLKSLVSLLEDFLVNSISTNLSLTQAFSTLASCGHTRLDPWLLGDPIQHNVPLDQSLPLDEGLGDSDHDVTITLKDAKSDANGLDVGDTVKSDGTNVTFQEPDRSSTAKSPIFAALDSLVGQVERFRHEIQEFDTYLAERRHVFRVGEDIDKALANDMPPPRKFGDSARPSFSRTRGLPQLGSISQRLMSETSSATGSRSSSPRGRQLNDSSTPKLADRLNHLRISPSPSPSKSAPRAFSQDSMASTPSKRIATPMGPGDALRQKIKIKTTANERSQVRNVSSETSSVRSESIVSEGKHDEEEREVTLSHLLTNIIILQEFMLELVAIVQARASLFGEVKFV